MKKLRAIVCEKPDLWIGIALVAAYILVFVLNNGFANHHSDFELLIPCFAGIFGAVFALVMGVHAVRCRKNGIRFDCIYFIIPALIIVSAVITLTLGRHMECRYCARSG